MSTLSQDAPSPPATAPTVRRLGSLHLRQLLGRTRQTMVWRVYDPRVDQELVIAMPRQRPDSPGAAQLWRATAKHAARIEHPSLAHVVDIGEHEHWPYVVYDPGQAQTLADRIGAQGQPALEMVPWAVQVLEGLAFAHDAGVVHGDLQPHMVLLPDRGPARLLGLGVAAVHRDEPDHDSNQLQQVRQAGERDLLAFGALMNQALTSQPALEEPDIDLAIDRLPPLGREMIRLPWSTARPISAALRSIVNRATDRQPRRRYHSARTLLRALEGWLAAEGEQGGGPLAQLFDRLGTLGVLPATPGAAQRAGRLALMERERNDELAEVVLQDTALTCELLRQVNTAQGRSGMGVGSGPILTIRRAIDMLGLDAVRHTALSLRDWPGPLNVEQADALEQLIARSRRAGRIARWLRPAGYDGELAFLLALLQNLGRMVVRYHFPDEAAQIERLMRPGEPTEAGGVEEPDMDEAAASFAVLGVDVATIGAAIGRHWGLERSMLHMIDRVAVDVPVRLPGSDDELMRLTASCANEVVDATALPTARQGAALQRIAQRYAKALGVSLRDLQAVARDQPPAVFQAPTTADAGRAGR